MQQPRFLCFAGSIRSGSFNHALAGAMAKNLSLMEMDVTFLSLADYPLPLFNADEEAERGLPENAAKLSGLLSHHDGVFIASPEYNGSVTPLLKNTLDWISRAPVEDRHPFKTPIFGLGSASRGKMGGMRSLAHLRDILTATGALVIPEQVSVGTAAKGFDEKGDITGEREANFLKACAEKMVHTARRMKMLEWT